MSRTYSHVRSLDSHDSRDHGRFQTLFPQKVKLVGFKLYSYGFLEIRILEFGRRHQTSSDVILFESEIEENWVM